MSLRDDLVRAGVPEQPSDAESLGVDRVERNIAMAQSSRTKVTVDGGNVVFEAVVGEPRRVEVEISRLWDSKHGRPLRAGELRETLKTLSSPSKEEVAAEDVAQAQRLGDVVGVDVNTLSALYLVESIKGFGPGKFRELHDAGVSPAQVADRPELLPISGKRGDDFRSALANLSDDDRQIALNRAGRQIVRAAEHQARILTFNHPLYPRNVRDSNNPIPVLYVRGNVEVLAEPRAVACVGSRKIRTPYAELHRQFAETAAREGFTIVSGFALGADTIGHEAALSAGGRTIAVMPSGLDRPFPPENRALWDELLNYVGGVFVSEFPFGTAAASLTLRKRNKLIVAFAQGVLVGQSSVSGGAMNAYRFALEQRKRIATFASDWQPDTSGNNFIVEEVERQQVALSASRSPAFPARPDRQEWVQWLHALSSST